MDKFELYEIVKTAAKIKFVYHDEETIIPKGTLVLILEK